MELKKECISFLKILNMDIGRFEAKQK